MPFAGSALALTGALAAACWSRLSVFVSWPSRAARRPGPPVRLREHAGRNGRSGAVVSGPGSVSRIGGQPFDPGGDGSAGAGAGLPRPGSLSQAGGSLAAGVGVIVPVVMAVALFTVSLLALAAGRLPRTRAEPPCSTDVGLWRSLPGAGDGVHRSAF